MTKQLHKLIVTMVTSLSTLVLFPLAAVVFNAPDSWVDNQTVALFAFYVALAFNVVAITIACAIHWHETH